MMGYATTFVAAMAAEIHKHGFQDGLFRVAGRLDESPYILFMAAGLDIPEAAKAVYSRLP